MIFPVYKEKGKTSRDVLNIIKRDLKEKKVGHGGTLDPLAEGVLIVGIGRESTKKLHSEEFNEKEYLGTVFLGKKSITDDEEGEKEVVKVEKTPTRKEVEDCLSLFEGVFEQKPPYFSAVKVKGKESYKLARKRVFLDLKKRKVEAKKIEILKYNYPFLKLKIITGKGFYVRSLARDIGEKLGTGGYLYNLIRSRVGNFTISDCYKDLNSAKKSA
ncbi:MAG: tRNA pseudouridine(55) synthase TruB [Patescibacteria group bacterium]|nr:tRNA pseudouridine(55) synthase TruB [Patescibacteria group bacterium]